MEIADFSLFSNSFDPAPAPNDNLGFGGSESPPRGIVPDWSMFLDEYQPVGGTPYASFYPRPIEVLRRDLDDLGERIATAMHNLSSSRCS